MAGPITTWIVRGLGMADPLGMARSEPPMPIGTIGAAGAGREERGALHQVFDHRALAARALGEEDEHAVLAQDLLGPLQRLAVGRLAVHGEGADREQQLAEPLVLPHLVLRHEEELAVGAEGGEPEVGERAVHRGQDHRPRLRARAPCP